MTRQEARRIVFRWLASNLKLADGFFSDRLSVEGEEKLNAAAKEIADELLRRSGAVEPASTLDEIIHDEITKRNTAPPPEGQIQEKCANTRKME